MVANDVPELSRSLSNFELEQTLLAGLLKYPDLLCQIEYKLQDKFFASPKCKCIFNIIKKFYANNPLEILTPRTMISLISDAKVKDIMLIKQLCLLIFQKEVDRAEVCHITDKIKHYYMLRVAHNGAIVIGKILNNGQDINQIRNAIADLHSDITFDDNQILQSEWSSNTDSFINELILRNQNPGKYRGVPTGIAEWDEHTFGLLPEEFGCILLPSGKGKTCFVLMVALHNALIGNNTLLLTIESSKFAMERRLHSSLSGVPHEVLRKANFTEEDIKKILSAQKSRPTMGRIDIVDIPQGPTPMLVQNLINRYKIKHPIHVVCIDYMNIMQTDDGVDAMYDWKAQLTLSKRLKEIARYSKIAIWSALQQADDGGAAFAKYIRQNVDVLLTAVDLDEGFRKLINLKTREADPNREFYIRSDFSTMRFDTGERPTKLQIDMWKVLANAEKE